MYSEYSHYSLIEVNMHIDILFQEDSFAKISTHTNCSYVRLEMLDML